MERGSRYENLPSIKLDIKDNAKMQKPYSQKYSFFFSLKTTGIRIIYFGYSHVFG